MFGLPPWVPGDLSAILLEVQCRIAVVTNLQQFLLSFLKPCYPSCSFTLLKVIIGLPILFSAHLIMSLNLLNLPLSQQPSVVGGLGEERI